MSDLRKQYRTLHKIVGEFLKYAFKYVETKEALQHMDNKKRGFDDSIIKTADDYIAYQDAKNSYLEKRKNLLNSIQIYQNRIQDLAKSFQAIEPDMITIIYEDDGVEYQVALFNALHNSYPIWKITGTYKETKQLMYIYAFDRKDAREDFKFSLNGIPLECQWQEQ